MYSDEAESFAKFLALAERFQALNPDNFVSLPTTKRLATFKLHFFHLQVVDVLENGFLLYLASTVPTWA
jgi:hypothetical protein